MDNKVSCQRYVVIDDRPLWFMTEEFSKTIKYSGMDMDTVLLGIENKNMKMISDLSRTDVDDFVYCNIKMARKVGHTQCLKRELDNELTNPYEVVKLTNSTAVICKVDPILLDETLLVEILSYLFDMRVKTSNTVSIDIVNLMLRHVDIK
jgi:hypothetical protein